MTGITRYFPSFMYSSPITYQEDAITINFAPLERPSYGVTRGGSYEEYCIHSDLGNKSKKIIYRDTDPISDGIVDATDTTIDTFGENTNTADIMSTDDALAGFLEFRKSLSETDENGYTPLMEAVYTGDISYIKGLLTPAFKVYMNLDYQHRISGYTPLHYAVDLNNETIVEMLLEAGADTSIESADGWTPAKLSWLRHKNENMIRILGEYCDPETLPVIQTQIGSFEKVDDDGVMDPVIPPITREEILVDLADYEDPPVPSAADVEIFQVDNSPDETIDPSDMDDPRWFPSTANTEIVQVEDIPVPVVESHNIDGRIEIVVNAGGVLFELSPSIEDEIFSDDESLETPNLNYSDVIFEKSHVESDEPTETPPVESVESPAASDESVEDTETQPKMTALEEVIQRILGNRTFRFGMCG